MKRMGRVVAVVNNVTLDIIKIISLLLTAGLCQIIWANASKKDLRKLQLVQYNIYNIRQREAYII